MNDFLKVVYFGHAENVKDGDVYIADKYTEMFQPFMDRLKDLLSEKMYEELDNIFSECASLNNSYYAAKGMELAVNVMNKTYIPSL